MLRVTFSLIISLILFFQLTLTNSFAFQINVKLITRPERTNYTETSTHQDVMDFINVIRSDPRVHIETIATSKEGRQVPLIVIADPPIATPEQAKASGKI